MVSWQRKSMIIECEISNNEHDYITTELNYIGGEWGAHVSDKNIDFSNSRFVIETVEQKQFVLVP